MMFFLRSNNVMQMPLRPALPVRPARWMNGSVLRGGYNWITSPTLSMSSPLEATSVAMSIFLLPLLKAAKLNSLSFCAISPWRKAASLPNSMAKSVTSNFFSAKIMVLMPSPPLYCLIKFLIQFNLSWYLHSTARNSTVVEVCVSFLLIRLIFFLFDDKYYRQILSTQSGIVAENIRFWVFCLRWDWICWKIY